MGPDSWYASGPEFVGLTKARDALRAIKTIFEIEAFYDMGRLMADAFTVFEKVSHPFCIPCVRCGQVYLPRSDSSNHLRRWAPATPRWTLTVFLLVLATAGVLPAHGQPLSDGSPRLPLLRKANSNPVHQGIATDYDATGAGACSFDLSPGDLMVAAINAEDSIRDS